jgi:hypothetical protein
MIISSYHRSLVDNEYSTGTGCVFGKSVELSGVRISMIYATVYRVGRMSGKPTEHLGSTPGRCKQHTATPYCGKCLNHCTDNRCFSCSGITVKQKHLIIGALRRIAESGKRIDKSDLLPGRLIMQIIYYQT